MARFWWNNWSKLICLGKTIEQKNWYKIGQKQNFDEKNDQTYLTMQNFDLKTSMKKIDQICLFCPKFWVKKFDEKVFKTD